MISYDDARCAGKYDHLHGEFGAVIHAQCVGCQRRTPGHAEYQWYQGVPEFTDECPSKIKE